MRKEIKKLPRSKIEIRVVLPWQDWEKFIETAIGELSKNIKIPGFRPGKAPRNLVEQKIGKTAVLEEAAGKAIQKSYSKIVQEEKIEALGSPRAEILKLAEGNDLEYKIETDVFPEIELKNWEESVKKVNARIQEEKIEANEGEVKKEIEKIAESRAKFITISREARKGDTVFADFEVFQDGVLLEKGSSKNHPLVLGKGVFIPGFEEQLEGMKENEKKEFDLIFPGEYHEKSLAGKPARFKVKINLVQERQIPEPNDEFAKSLGKFENMEDLKKSVSDGLRQEKEARKKEKQKTEILEELAANLRADLPEILVREELRKMFLELEEQAKYFGITLDDYLVRIKKTKDDLEKEWKSRAETRIKSALALEELVKEKDIHIPSEAIESEMNKALQYYKNAKSAEKNIDMEKLYNHAKRMLENEKIMQFLEKL